MSLPRFPPQLGFLPTPSRRDRSPILATPAAPANTSADPFAVETSELDAEAKDHPSYIHGVDTDTYHSASQEYQTYLQRHGSPFLGHSACKRLGRLNYADQIDPIAPCLVAKLRLGLLLREIESCPLPFVQSLLAGLDILRLRCTNIDHLLETNQDVISKARERKRIRDELPKINTTVCGALRYLQEKCSFLDREPWSSTKPKVGCGAFFVEKSNGKLRVILDGRHANVLFRPSFSSFSFFTLETLRNVIGNLSTGGKKFYAVNLDLRHWFHQIPLNPIFRQFLGMNLQDRNYAPGEFWLFPKSLPMGWIHAPYLAQCSTWALLFARSKNPDGAWASFSRDYDVDEEYLQKLFPKNDTKRQAPPTWIPLKSGGGIFVFLDNILVLSPREDIAKRWYAKITDACRKYHAILKGVKEESYDDPEVTAAMDRDTLAESCFVTLSPESPTNGFDFLGVRWTYGTKSVVMKEDDKIEMFASHIQSDGRWKGTRREMARFLGRIMWYRRVHGLHYLQQKCHPSPTLVKTRLLPPPRLSLKALPALQASRRTTPPMNITPNSSSLMITPWLSKRSSAERTPLSKASRKTRQSRLGSPAITSTAVTSP